MMTMSALLIAALAVATPPVAPPAPPPVLRVPDYPVPALADSRNVPVCRASFDVEIRADAEILWSGPMRVATRIPARFTRMKMDAAPANCTADYGGVGQSNTSLTVNLSQSYYGNSASDAYQFNLSWERPGDEAGCTGRANTRSVGINQGIDLKPNQQIVLKGDGGLTVRIRRRD